jgi:hypothetical protein
MYVTTLVEGKGTSRYHSNPINGRSFSHETFEGGGPGTEDSDYER